MVVDVSLRFLNSARTLSALIQVISSKIRGIRHYSLSIVDQAVRG